MRAGSASSISTPPKRSSARPASSRPKRIAPLDAVGDREGARCANGVVTTPTGFRDAYRRWAEAGWAGVTAKPEYGGMGLPHAVAAACNEMWSGASMGFALCPLLGEGAIGALEAYGSDALRAAISAAWSPANGPAR